MIFGRDTTCNAEAGGNAITAGSLLNLIAAMPTRSPAARATTSSPATARRHPQRMAALDNGTNVAAANNRGI